MADGRPPHPGTRPEQLRFPFDEASRAAAEARTLASDLRGLGRLVGQDLDDLASTSFAGRFADWLLAAAADACQEVSRRASALDDLADLIESSLGHARIRVADRDDQIMRFERRLRQWRDWEQPVGAGRT